MLETHWTIRFLAWWSVRGGFVLFGVFFSSFILVFIFGNYPEWIYEKEYKEFQQFLDVNEQHLRVGYFTESRKGSALVSIEYHDGFSPSHYDDSRPNKDEIIRRYKSIVESRICSHTKSQQWLLENSIC